MVYSSRTLDGSVASKNGISGAGVGDLDRGGIDDGNTKMLLCRMQWL